MTLFGKGDRFDERLLDPLETVITNLFSRNTHRRKVVDRLPVGIFVGEGAYQPTGPFIETFWPEIASWRGMAT